MNIVRQMMSTASKYCTSSSKNDFYCLITTIKKKEKFTKISKIFKYQKRRIKKKGNRK